MHLWNYQHNYGTTNWINAVLGDGSTHSHRENANVAFHEGFASYARDELMHDIWGRAPKKPVTRWHLTQSGLQGIDRVEHHDDGVKWGLRLLTATDIYRYEFGPGHNGSHGTYPDRVDQPARCPRAPNLDFWDVVRVFKPHASKGWDRQWEVHRKDYGLRRFFRRAADILDQFSEADRLMYLDMLDSTVSREPQSRCRGPLGFSGRQVR